MPPLIWCGYMQVLQDLQVCVVLGQPQGLLWNYVGIIWGNLAQALVYIIHKLTFHKCFLLF